MLKRWKQLPHSQTYIPLPPPPESFRLHAMVGSLGFSRVTSLTYDWHGLRRGDGTFSLFQYTISGRGKLDYKGKSFDVLPGQAMLLHFPYDNHYWLPENATHWEFIFVCLYGEEMLRLWEMYERMAGPLVSLDENSDSVETAFMMYERAYHAQITSPFEASELAYRLAMQIGREAVPISGSKAGMDFEAVKLYCRFNLHKSISVEMMAQVAGMSRYHFSRRFKECEGLSPAVYIERLQIERASDLLRNSTRSVKEIADSCGYADPSYFTKAFKRALNLTPLEYRRRI